MFDKATCYHEAGHAVMHLANGESVEKLVVNSLETIEDAENHGSCVPGRPVDAYAELRYRQTLNWRPPPNPHLWPGRLSQAERRYARSALKVYLGGPDAQRLFEGRFLESKLLHPVWEHFLNQSIDLLSYSANCDLARILQLCWVLRFKVQAGVVNYRFPYLEAGPILDQDVFLNDALADFLEALPATERRFLKAICRETTETLSLHWEKVAALAEALHSDGQLAEPEIAAIWREGR